MSKKSYSGVAKVVDLSPRVGSGYPSPLEKPCRTRAKTVLGDQVGLSQFGVNLLVLQPGNWSAQRHWHENEDEFIYILEGEVTLVTDEGETVLQAGEVAGFPAGQPNGHHLVNKSSGIVRVLEVGTRAQNDTASYPDVDLMAVSENGKYRFTHKNGEPYE
jgi:uncharacterized cupin superfamily protein